MNQWEYKIINVRSEHYRLDPNAVTELNRLGSERFTTGHPRNPALLLNQARQVAELTGALREGGFLQRLAALEIDLLAFSAYYRHAAALHGAKRAPFSMAPVIKAVGGELGQRADVEPQPEVGVAPEVHRGGVDHLLGEGIDGRHPAL